MSLFFILSLVMVIASAIYLSCLNYKTAQVSLENQSAQIRKEEPELKISKRNRIGIVFLANILFYLFPLIIPSRFLRYSIIFFAIQIILNLAAAAICWYLGKFDMARTFLLFLLWVFLLGPAISLSLCFIVLGVLGNLT